MRAFKGCTLIVVLFGFSVAWNYSRVELYEKAYYSKGAALIIPKNDKNRCYNFYKSNISSFNDMTSSIKLNGNCIHIFSGVGCSGTFIILNASTHGYYSRNLENCRWNNKISSLAWCESSFPLDFQQPNGSQGYPCIDSCENRGRNYFWCHTATGSIDYCQKRPGLDYFGNECELNCRTLEEFNLMPIFYEDEDYKGRSLELAKEESETRCYSFRYVNESYVNLDNAISSVDIKLNCIYLYEHIGCTGKSLELSVDKNVYCQANLAACLWNDLTSSFRFCHTQLHNSVSRIGSRGFYCHTPCLVHDMSYFWCNLGNGKWDYCSPRPGTNYLGKDCTDNCSSVEPHYHQSATLYSETRRRGKWIKISSEDQRRCVNLVGDEGLRLEWVSSLRLEGSCVVLYKEIGCSGYHSRYAPEDEPRCHEYLNFCGNRRSIRAASVRFCNNEIAPEYTKPSGMRGLPCSTFCQTQGRFEYIHFLFFWCGVNDAMDWDFCSPRQGTDALGEDCEGNCTQNNENLLQLERRYRGEERAVLYLQKDFMGRSKVLEKGTGVVCLNLGYESDTHINWNKMVNSIELSTTGPIAYINLYSGIGCSEDTFRLSSKHSCGHIWYSWKDKVSSVSFSYSALPHPFTKPLGVNGEVCLNACLPRGKLYFWCNVGNGSWDFCSPRPGQNFMGNFCGGDCTEAPVHKQRATLYSEKWFEGGNVTIEADNDTISCFNMKDIGESSTVFSNAIYSIAIENGGCLILFDREDCGGEKLMISHDHNWECLRDLDYCKWHPKVSSVSFCSTIPENQGNKVGYSGEHCASSCFMWGMPYFWCYLETGGRDYCSPSPGYDSNGKKCKGNCSINGFDLLEHKTYGDPTAVVLHMGTYFQGKNITISWTDKKMCFNLGYNDESATNFNKMIHSVDLTPTSSACLLLYSSAGCTGESLLVATWHNRSCLSSLDDCNWAFKVSSLSSCETQSRKIRISPALSGTTPMNRLRARLYVKPEFQANHITIDGNGTTKCFTLGYDAELSINFNNALMSIALDNGACLHLYDRIGCLGTPFEISFEKNPKCLWNLEDCEMHRKVSSLSFCSTSFPSEYRLPIGVQGNPCSDSCNGTGIQSTYFSCRTNLSWDFCSPRPGVNYFGEDLTADVSYEEAAILYDQAKFKGHGAVLRNSEKKLCHNWQEGDQENFRRHPASIDLRGSCLQIYDGVGCSGNSLEIVADDVDNCHVDLRPCGWHNRVLSIRFCNAPWPEKFTQPNGSLGDHCNDDCDTRGKPYFWCHVQNDTSDYCLPRPGQDLFGNDCEEKCMNLSDLDLIVSGSTEASASLRKDPSNLCLSVSLLVTTLWLYY